MIQTVLAFETSCDDTSVAIVEKHGRVVGVVSASQDLAHAPFGGIVPEIASRNHTLTILPLLEELFRKTGKSWNDIQGIAVTNRPGLVGSLIVGLVTAKTLAQAHQLPLIGVNHLEGHLLAPFLSDEQYTPPANLTYPYLALAISGGHTSLYSVEGLGAYRVLGATKDDAAGEAFDKFAKMIGLGFPGGVKVDQLAKTGDATAYQFPRSMLQEENYDMSFSGLKSAAQRVVQNMSHEEIQKNLQNLCASYQEAIVDVLLGKLQRGVTLTGMKQVVITGGVSANSRLRARAQEWATARKLTLVIPPIRYCTDNAAMIGFAGILKLNQGIRHDLNLGPSPQAYESDFL